MYNISYLITCDASDISFRILEMTLYNFCVVEVARDWRGESPH